MVGHHSLSHSESPLCLKTVLFKNVYTILSFKYSFIFFIHQSMGRISKVHVYFQKENGEGPFRITYFAGEQKNPSVCKDINLPQVPKPVTECLFQILNLDQFMCRLWFHSKPLQSKKQSNINSQNVYYQQGCRNIYMSLYLFSSLQCSWQSL